MSYQEKYLKYKNKYLALKKAQEGGHASLDECAFFFSEHQMKQFHKLHRPGKKDIEKGFDELMLVEGVHRKGYFLSNNHLDTIELNLTDRE